jgi:hypothetical protein
VGDGRVGGDVYGGAGAGADTGAVGGGFAAVRVVVHPALAAAGPLVWFPIAPPMFVVRRAPDSAVRFRSLYYSISVLLADKAAGKRAGSDWAWDMPV